MTFIWNSEPLIIYFSLSDNRGSILQEGEKNHHLRTMGLLLPKNPVLYHQNFFLSISFTDIAIKLILICLIANWTEI